MKHEEYTPDVVDFAYQIISMDNKIHMLEGEVEHLKELNKIHRESINRSDKHTKEITGIILGAVLDPESSINKH